LLQVWQRLLALPVSFATMLHSFLTFYLLSFTSAISSEYVFHSYDSEPIEGDGTNTAGIGAVGNSYAASFGNATINIRVPYALDASSALPLDGYTKITEIQDGPETWTAHEDLKKRDGNLIFASKSGQQRVFPKTAELYAPTAADSKYPLYNGRKIAEVGMALADLLADDMLKNGEPIEEQVRGIIPPLTRGPAWTSFVGNVQANDVVAVYAAGGTKPYHANLILPEAARYSRGRLEGYVGGWMPAVRKVVPVNPASPESEYFETVIFGDVDAPDPFIVQTWHRVQWVRNGQVVKTEFGHSYPSFSLKQKGPEPAEFYKALFRFGEYWEKHLSDFTPLTLPDPSWTDMTKYAFAKELMTRPGGVYPKYGAFDRDYAGTEYDGFQVCTTCPLSTQPLLTHVGHLYKRIELQSRMGSL
jgi:hypothetical protein